MTGRPIEIKRLVSTAPSLFERLLAAGAVALLAFVVSALLRGRDHWSQTSDLIWAHLATIVLALGLTPIMLFRRRGDRFHRQLGWVWIISLTATAAFSFGIRTIHPHRLSPIHILSAFTLVQAPLVVWYARLHRVAAHRKAVCSLVAGALLIAGFFTFPFDRMLGRWLFG